MAQTRVLLADPIGGPRLRHRCCLRSQVGEDRGATVCGSFRQAKTSQEHSGARFDFESGRRHPVGCLPDRPSINLGERKKYKRGCGRVELKGRVAV